MTMKVIKTIPEMRAWTQAVKARGETVGFVPTMGFLHEGHLSLIRQAKKRAQRVVVSIYVNPTQFGPNEDFEKYPRDFERDEQLCKAEGVDAVFYPDDNEMYSSLHKTYVITEDLSQVLCGRSRPTHFRGVTTVVAKLFNIVQPDFAVFGQKDAQQAIIIKRMAEDLNFPVEIVVAPIIREKDGLAMSSRNKYLSPRQRKEATVLYRSLKMAEQEYSNGNHDIEDIKKKMRQLIEAESSGKIDYIEAVDAETLGPPRPGERPILIALAVYFEPARLIDNIILQKG
ncbi:Pantothenate synthetase [Caldithrix abyssi DSM 13497]|uniref:Pantothenate synthetase n=2 Tax=Caldithrix abyssi TaxID=187145 RepID=H1XSD9_CALAY|nr:panC pantothenate synthetase [Caldithrix abyssi DSM 13497]EHO41351.1 Pantothenate synthetase [Caldithrix abyssi DSM 13497]